MSFLKIILKPIVNTLFRVEIHNLDKLDFSEPTILMPNHTSLLDAIILGMNLPDEVCFVVNTAIAKQYHLIVNMREHITVNPLNPFSIRQMIKEVKNGKTLMIFPEGRLTMTGGFMKIYSGPAHLALKSNARVYPITLKGLDRSSMSYITDKVKSRWFPKVSIRIGDPYHIDFDESKTLKTQKKIASDKILKLMQSESVISEFIDEINLFDKLLEATKNADINSIILEDISQKVSYKNLLLSIYALSDKFKGKVGVGVLLPNAVAHVATLFALFKNGTTPAILNFSLGQQSLIDCCETASIKEVITSKVFIEKGKLENIIEAMSSRVKITYLEDIKSTITTADKLRSLANFKLRKRSNIKGGKLILFTSGSESKPKGVVLSHNSIYTNIKQAKSVIDMTDKDKFLNVLPMFHSFGLTAGTLLPLLNNVQLFLYPTPLHYRVIPEIAYDRSCTILFGTSTFLKGYGKNAHSYDFYSLRYVFAGAEKLKDEVREMWVDKFGIRIYEGYGTTEASPIISLNTPLLYKKGSVGCMLPCIEHKIEPVEGIENGGNLLIKGANLMDGYLIHGEGFKPLEGWYTTGDIVEIDEEGFIHIKSRLKRFAKIAGEMISLNLVEELASKCFGTSDLATVAKPDANKGERILLFVTNKEITLSAMREFLKIQGMSPLLMPAELIIVDIIQLLGSGKIDYTILQR